jgi:hypothetical protein
LIQIHVDIKEYLELDKGDKDVEISVYKLSSPLVVNDLVFIACGRNDDLIKRVVAISKSEKHPNWTTLLFSPVWKS